MFAFFCICFNNYSFSSGCVFFALLGDETQPLSQAFHRLLHRDVRKYRSADISRYIMKLYVSIFLSNVLIFISISFLLFEPSNVL